MGQPSEEEDSLDSDSDADDDRFSQVSQFRKLSQFLV
jgi:hypothetical protein